MMFIMLYYAKIDASKAIYFSSERYLTFIFMSLVSSLFNASLYITFDIAQTVSSKIYFYIVW